jgi:hypothetical protein
MQVSVRTVHRDYNPAELRNGIVLLLVGLGVAYFCVSHFYNAYRQHASRDFPSVLGKMTEYRHKSLGASPCSKLVVAYDYDAGGRRYENSRIRYVYRGIDAGLEIPRKRAMTWGKRTGRVPCV